MVTARFSAVVLLPSPLPAEVMVKVMVTVRRVVPPAMLASMAFRRRKLSVRWLWGWW